MELLLPSTTEQAPFQQKEGQGPPRPVRLRALVAAMLATAALASGCGRPATYRRVHLGTVGPVSPGPFENRLALRVAVASVLSPRDSFEAYGDVLTYLEARLGRPVAMIQRATYAEINDLVRAGGVDVALVCSGAYVVGRREFGMALLVAPQIRGETLYYSYLIVPADSATGKLEELRGKTFAFSDPLSNSGRFAPAYQLRVRLGETPDGFFRRYIFTYSHDRSIEAVAAKLVDGAAVDSLVYDAFKSTDPPRVAGTRVIEVWGPYGAPPVVVNPRLNPQIKEQVRDVLVRMHEDPEGRRILQRLHIERFVPAPDSLYQAVRDMVAALGL